METRLEKCGIIVDPPSFVIVYRSSEKLKRKIFPIRDFAADSDIDEVAASTKAKLGLEGVPLVKIKKMLRVLQETLNGTELSEAVKKIQKQHELKCNEDLNKLSTEELEIQKELMESLFLKNQIKKEDENFVYDKRMDFSGPKMKSEWDSDADDNFWN